MTFKAILQTLRRLFTAWSRTSACALPRRLAFSRRGNVAIIAAVGMIPVALAAGVGVDYAIQKRGQDQLDGIADAAALIATTPAMMTNSPLTAATAANAYWTNQSAGVFNVTVNAPTATNGAAGTSATVGDVTVTDAVNGTVVTRTVTVSWTGTSTTYFSSLVGVSALPLGGASKASASAAPNINFYLLVDTSPSMAIAATTAGISQMVSKTAPQGGCAFACHETNPANDNLQNPSISNPVGGGVCCVGKDNFALARALGVTLRIDLVNYAVSNLMSTASTMATTNLTTYGISVSTIDYTVHPLYQTGNITTNLAAAQSKVGTLSQLEVAYNGCLTITNCNLSNAGNDQDSSLDLGLSTLNTLNANTYSSSAGPGFQMYTPGMGTNSTSDSPQEVLFVITDGVIDESYNGNRKMAPINTIIDNCTAIKSNNIRIAFLYLTYNPLPTNTFYNQNIASFQPSIATAAQNCASPGLYQQVSTDGDVSAALNSLFQTAVATAHLTQ